MSEINCHGDEVVYSEVVPGWSLVQLVNLTVNRKDLNIVNRDYKFYVNSFVMGEGDFGLTHCNDPDFVFSLPPMLEPKMEDSSGNITEEWLTWKKNVLNHYSERLLGSVDVCYKLMSDCIEAGYNLKEDGSLVWWLLPKMYKSYQKGKLRTWTKSNGLIIYQSDLPKEPYMPIVRLRDTKLPIEELKYTTTPNWLKQATNNFTKEIVYVEYSHWDELTDKHYHAIWSLDYVTWKCAIKELGSYEHDYTFTEIIV